MKAFTGTKSEMRWKTKRMNFKCMKVATKKSKIDYRSIWPNFTSLDRAPFSTRCFCTIEDGPASFSTSHSKSTRPRFINLWLATAFRSRTWLWRRILIRIVCCSTSSVKRIKTSWYQRHMLLILATLASYKVISNRSRLFRGARSLSSWSTHCSNRNVTKP